MKPKRRDETDMEAIKDKTFPFAVVAPKDEENALQNSKESSEPRHSWGTQRLLDLGIKEMAGNSPKPFWNATNLGVAISFATFLLLVAGLIGGGAWYLGYQAATIQNLQMQIKTASDKADTATTLAVGGQSQEEPAPTPNEKKK